MRDRPRGRRLSVEEMPQVRQEDLSISADSELDALLNDAYLPT